MLSAQIPKKELKDLERSYKEQLKQGYDVVLDPIQNFILQEVNPANIRNWGVDYTQSKALEPIIRQRAKQTVRVYVFDTAGDLDHPDLEKAERPGAIFTGEASGADGHGHGTHVAGTIGALGSYDLGIGRMLSEIGRLEIVPVKVLNNSGSALYNWIANAGEWAIADMAKVENKGKRFVWNYSLGGGGSDPTVSAVMAKGMQAGATIFAASGNSYQRGVGFPARDVSAKAVAALQQSGAGVERAPYSTTGPEVWIAAPGSNIMSTLPGGAYGAMSGTSMATPSMVGLFAVVASCNPGCSNAQVLNAVQQFAVDLAPGGKDEETGFGALQLGNILEKPLCDGNTPTPDPKPDPKPEPQPDPVKPEPTKPLRWVTVAIPEAVTVKWRPMNEQNFRETKVIFTVAIQTTKPAATAAKELREYVLNHFSNRAYILLVDADDADAGYWAAYFLELISSRAATPLKLNTEYVYVLTPGAACILTDPVAGGKAGPTWKASVKAGVFTVNFETGKPETWK
jgi:subtilisin family serine protease